MMPHALARTNRKATVKQMRCHRKIIVLIAGMRNGQASRRGAERRHTARVGELSERVGLHAENK